MKETDQITTILASMNKVLNNYTPKIKVSDAHVTWSDSNSIGRSNQLDYIAQSGAANSAFSISEGANEIISIDPLIDEYSQAGKRNEKIIIRKEAFSDETPGNNPTETFNFQTASLNVDLFQMLDVDDLIGLTTRAFDMSDANAMMMKTVQRMLSAETTLSTNASRIRLYRKSDGQTVDHVLQKIATGGKVALPVPNWVYWGLRGAEERQYEFAYFDAFDADQLVDGFRKLAESQRLKAVVLNNPSNPLGYLIGRDHSLAIDQIALKHGIEVIIDDVARGSQPIGMRESIGSFFSRPFVVEGFSHRFGPSLRQLSYVHIPDGDETLEKEALENNPQILLLDLAYDSVSTKIVQMLEERNRLFDAYFGAACKSVRPRRPSRTNITNVIDLPEDLAFVEGPTFEKLYSAGLYAIPINMFYPDAALSGPNYKKSSSMIRVAVGELELSQLREGASRLGQFVERQHDLSRIFQTYTQYGSSLAFMRNIRTAISGMKNLRLS